MTIKRLLTAVIGLFLFSAPVLTQKLFVDESFPATVNGDVNFIEILSDGKILIAGEFTNVNNTTRVSIARLNADGTIDTSFDANGVTIMPGPQFAPILGMEVLPDGKILLAGFFGGGQPLEYVRAVVRLNADGSFDNTLTSIPQIRSGPNFYVKKAAQLPDGKILLCGNFTLANGNAQPRLARYNSNGTYDATFTTAIDGDCNDLDVQPDGKYLVSGYFATVNGSPRRGLARFNTDGSLDTTFNAAPLPDGTAPNYSGVKLQGNGKIIGFQYGSSDQYVSRLNADGSSELTFPTTFFRVSDAAYQPNGKLIAVGEYRLTSGQSLDFNRFNADGTHDPSLNRLSFYGSGTGPKARAVAVQADGKVIVGGGFTQIAVNNTTINRSFLARLAPQAIPIRPKFDFDGDGRDDLAVFRPSDRIWYQNRSTSGFFAMQFGLPQDQPVVNDYDGDGRADIAIFRDGAWYWLRSSDSTLSYGICGQAGDIPQSADFGGTGRAGFVVFRPSEAKFYVNVPFQNPAPLDMGMPLLPTDKPVIADYDGDGKADLAVFRNGDWFFRSSNDGQIRHYQFGLAGDKPVIGDFDGDLRTDYAVFRPSTGIWYIQKSTEGFYAVQWGLAGDLPVPADFDGDGKADIAVYRDGVWYQIRSSGSIHIEQFGLANDVPVQLK